MKRCPRCGHAYTDELINFCLNDGELLQQFETDEPPTLFSDPLPSAYADDSPPTVMMDRGRTTNASNWPTSNVPSSWAGASPVAPTRPYGIANFQIAQDKTLPTVSLILGICAVFMVCCYGGILLGVPAAIVGFLAMRNADNDPSRYGGRGMAIAGLVLGVVTFITSMIFAFFGVLVS
ncbi:MAG TPA: DUF4190 domain-containing protein [Pyrinomonadaceae bacterium]|nr:DUF4190 domain-containing protein [Pyrinomonadaceae bacterium]